MFENKQELSLAKFASLFNGLPENEKNMLDGQIIKSNFPGSKNQLFIKKEANSDSKKKNYFDDDDQPTHLFTLKMSLSESFVPFMKISYSLYDLLQNQVRLNNLDELIKESDPHVPSGHTLFTPKEVSSDTYDSLVGTKFNTEPFSSMEKLPCSVYLEEVYRMYTSFISKKHRHVSHVLSIAQYAGKELGKRFGYSSWLTEKLEEVPTEPGVRSLLPENFFPIGMPYSYEQCHFTLVSFLCSHAPSLRTHLGMSTDDDLFYRVVFRDQQCHDVLGKTIIDQFLIKVVQRLSNSNLQGNLTFISELDKLLCSSEMFDHFCDGLVKMVNSPQRRDLGSLFDLVLGFRGTTINIQLGKNSISTNGTKSLMKLDIVVGNAIPLEIERLISAVAISKQAHLLQIVRDL